MSGAWKAKRFWKEAHVAPDGDGWQVTLDGRVLRSPAKAALRLPTRAMAEAVAAEWDAQEGEIAPLTMPVTRAANAAIDKVIPQRAEVIAMLADYGGTDLICYRAESPESLIVDQAAGWDPLLDWATDRYGARLICSEGVVPVAQDPAALARLAAPLHAADAFALTALYDLVTLSGSLVLGLAVAEGRLRPEEGWALSRIDESWQQAQWGQDAEAKAESAAKARQFCNAWNLLTLLRAD